MNLADRFIDELAREKQLRHDVVFALQTEIDELRVKKEEAEVLLQSERRIVASLRKELKEVAKILNGGTL